jgi:hypothetical protein
VTAGDTEVRKLYLEGLKDPLFTSRMALSWICLPALLFKARSKTTYYLTATLLGIIAIVFVRAATEHRDIPPFGDALPTRIAGWFLASLSAMLFYRFTFGRPSRDFFGFASETSNSQEKGRE